MNFISFCLALGLIWAPPAQADLQVRSDFAFTFDNQIFQAPEWQLHQFLKGSKQLDLPGFDVVKPLPTHIETIHAKVDYEFQSSIDYIALGEERNLTSKSFQISAVIDRISASGDMEIELPGGGSIIVRVDATCVNIPVWLKPGAGSVQAILRSEVFSNGRIGLSFPWINWSMAPDAWEMGTATCTGTQGFDQEIKKYLFEWLNDKNRWDAILRQKLQEKVVDLENQINGELFKSRELANSVNDYLGHMRVQMIPDRVEVREVLGPMLLRGKIIVDIESNDTGTTDVHFLDSLNSISLRNLYLPDDFFIALLGAASRSKAFSSPLMGDKFAAFKSLKDSTTTAWLVWPELNRYDSATDFKFIMDLKAPLQAAMEAAPVQDSTAYGQLSASLHILTQVYKRGTFQPMIHFNMPLSSRFSIFIQNQTFYMQFINSKGALTSSWDKSYKVFDSTIKTATMGDSIHKSLRATPGQALFDMPPVVINSKMSLKPQSMVRRGRTLIIRTGP